MHSPATLSVALLERNSTMPHWYCTPLSELLTLMTVTAPPIYAGDALFPVRLLLVVAMWHIISTFAPFLSQSICGIAPDDIKTTHVNVAL